MHSAMLRSRGGLQVARKPTKTLFNRSVRGAVLAFYCLHITEGTGVFGRLIYGEWAFQPGNKFTTGFNLLFLAIVFTLFARAVRHASRVSAGAWIALGVALFLVASSLWSIDPAFTFRRASLYLAVVMGAVGLSHEMTTDEFMKMMVTVSIVSALASLALLAVAPQSALMPDPDIPSLRGIFSQKNVLGQAMAAGALAALHTYTRTKRRGWINLVAIGLFVVVTLLSKSATSLLIMVAASATYGLVFLYRRGGALRTLSQGLTALGVLVGAVVVFSPEIFLDLLGKDPTLTGRSDLWALVWVDITVKPVFGWGFQAFWATGNPAADEISNSLGWTVPQAHNGVLEILLNIGAVGGLIFLGLLLRTLIVASRALRSPSTSTGLCCLVCCGAILILGVSETVLMEPFQITTSLFFITGLQCERAIREARVRARMRRRLHAGLLAQEGRRA